MNYSIKDYESFSKAKVEVNYIRHGEAFILHKGTELASISQSSYDAITLTDKGKIQAQSAAKELSVKINRDETIILLYSPIKRAYQTAQIIKSELAKHSILIEEELVIDFLRSAEGLDRFKNESKELSGNDLFEKWIKAYFPPKITYLESYLKVAERFKKFLRYVMNFRTKYPESKKIRIIAVAHAELPDYIMVKYFNNYGLANCETLNIDINRDNEVLLSISGEKESLKIRGTLDDLIK